MPRPRTLPTDLEHDGDTYQPPIYFPQFVSKPIWRTYAILNIENNTIVTKDTFYHFTGGGELIKCLFTNNLLLLIPKWSNLPDDIFDVIMNGKGHIWCNARGVPRSFQCYNRGRSTRWIIDSMACWQLPATLATCELLESVALHTGAGTCTTHGSLGLNMLRNTWPLMYPDDPDVDMKADDYQPEWHKHRHVRPSNGTCLWLQNTCIGARSEVVADSQEEFPLCWEVDRKNAYGDGLRLLPSGYSECFWREDTAPYFSYYADCIVTLTKDIPYGLFLVKKERGVNIAPTSTGQYRTCLWKEEIDYIRSKHDCGIEIEILQGEGWREATRDCSLFVDIMEEKRDNAPNEAIADEVKRSLVAAIGRLNMPPTRYELTDKETDTPLVSLDGVMYDLYAQKVIDPRPSTMPHWYSYVAMIVRLELTKEAEKWHAQEFLLGSNTDCVYVKAEANLSGYASANIKKRLRSGEWSYKPLTCVRFPANRHIISVEKIRRPGVRRL